MEIIKIMVLDYSTGVAHTYTVKMKKGWQSEDVEELLKLYHRMSDCYWMTFSDIEEHQGILVQ